VEGEFSDVRRARGSEKFAEKSSKVSPFRVCALLRRRLQRKGASGFLRSTKGVLDVMPFVVEAVLLATVAVLAVFVMYLLVHRWL
jgi:hypothetical protein